MIISLGNINLKSMEDIVNQRDISKKIPVTFGHTDQSTNYESLTEDQFQSLMADSTSAATITVEVVYVTNDKQIILEAQVPRGANIEDAVVLSGLLEQCSEVDLAKNKFGLYGMIKPLSETLTDGDRVEIYRPVTAKV